LSDLLTLKEHIGSDVAVAVNLSAIHLREATLLDFLLAVLVKKKLRPTLSSSIN
jgi:EAL domain-containing protein (putative c-di-GMP-specific phosphodiesterase class I)